MNPARISIRLCPSMLEVAGEQLSGEAALAAVEKGQDDAADELSRVKADLERYRDEVSSLKNEIEKEREASGLREQSLVRSAALARAEEIGHSVEHIVRAFRHWQNNREAPDPIGHLSTMMDSLLRILASKDVPVGR